MTVWCMAQRQTISLDGIWDFRHEHDEAWRTITVPGPWQAEHVDLRHESGRAHYRRTFAVPEDGECVAIGFGAVSYYCQVFLNGVRLGSHEGGYLPFEFVVVRESLVEENVLDVEVVQPDGDATATPDFPFAEIPHGKQSWYGPLAGIWQSVVIETRSDAHVLEVKIDARLSDGAVNVVLATTAVANGLIARVTVGDVVAQVVIADGRGVVSLVVPDVQPWSPDSPNLYDVRVEIVDDQRVVDAVTRTIGFRNIETRGGKFFLNGEPLYIRGALDQDYYPVGLCTPPSLEFLEDQVRKAKALGLNLLRCHIKVPDPRYYDVADRFGLLIWTEIPNVATFTEKSAQRMRDVMAGIVARDGHHPSIIAWTLINEDWGTRLIEDATHRAWLRDTYDWLKRLDPTRLVVDNSACHSNFHVKSDINDYHYYRSVPERREEWDKLTEEFAGAAKWTYSPHGDAEWLGREPLVVSEFGVWGLPDPALLRDSDGEEPWWMETGASWGDGAAYPHGIENRFAALRLASVFGDFAAFIEAAQWYQFHNLKYEIESLRAHDAIQGYVITEFTDVQWEANGLLDMNRNPRVFHKRLGEVNAETMIVPTVARYSAWCGDEFAFDVAVSTGTSGIADAVLKWHVVDGPSGTFAVDAVVSCSTKFCGTVHFSVPARAAAYMCEIKLTLLHGEKELALNQFEIAAFPKRDVKALPRIATHNSDIATFARGLGYAVSDRDGDVTIAHSLEAADINRMQSGACYLVLADGTEPTNGNLRRDKARREQPFMPIVDDIPGNLPNADTLLPNIVLHQRQGTLWRGDWIACFSWIKRKGAFAALPGGPLLDIAYDRVVPYHVMTGFRTWEYGGAVHAGLVLGWIHKPAATIAERRVGEGKVVATTFRLLRDAPGDDPVAAVLFDVLVELAR
jgi:Glycosyl hydrolases family 2, TIM barrel domain/Glycosyl hydrolases family 2/Glycosyl hydrolases family 2, sugar binding domain